MKRTGVKKKSNTESERRRRGKDNITEIVIGRRK
jgi:hypothetical protein